GLAARVFGDARRASGTVAQVVELRATHRGPHGDLDLVDARGVHREDALDADAVGHLADGEGLAVLATATTKDRAFEHLDALLVALDDLHVHAHGVAGLEGRHVLAELAVLDPIDRIHGERAFYRPF